MELYPLVLKLKAVPCLVVGGGSVAARKVSQLLAAGAEVTVVSPRLGEELRSLALQGRVRHLPRRYREGTRLPSPWCSPPPTRRR